MIDFQIPRTNKALQAKLTDRCIKIDVNRMAYTIGWQQVVEEIQKTSWY